MKDRCVIPYDLVFENIEKPCPAYLNIYMSLLPVLLAVFRGGFIIIFSYPEI